MATKADLMRSNALHEVGEDYVWGAQGTGGVEGADDYDCSGFVWRMYNNVGITKPRTTADGFMHMSHPIGAPRDVGDFFVFRYSSGHAHHIGLFVGKSQVVEARSPRLGVCLGTVAEANRRGAQWFSRLADLGKLTVPIPPKPNTYPRWKVSASALNLRSGPGVQYSRVTVLQHDTVLQQLLPAANGWMKVKVVFGVPQFVGFVSTKYIVRG